MFKKLRNASPLLLMGAIFSASIPLAAFSAQVLSPPISAIASSSTAILNLRNNGLGSAITAQAGGNTIIAVSQHQNGVVGLTRFSASNAINNGAGVIGFDGTSSAYNQGVAGESINGTGVYAESKNENRAGQAINAIARAGRGIVSTVNGASNSPDCGLAAISAFSAYATAVLADSSADLCGGIAADSASVGIGVTANSVGIAISEQQNAKGPTGFAVEGEGEGGAAFVAHGPIDPSSFDTPPALYLGQRGKGLVVEAVGTSGGLSLDNNGNLTISGKLTQHGTPGAATSEGDAALNRPLLAANLKAATIEDVGEGRLLLGQGYVRMDTALARKIDFSQTYQVVITPEGPSTGVYVTRKSPQGFAVRENPGGHSTISFSYRLVAKALPIAQTQRVKRLDLHNLRRIKEKLEESARQYRRRAIPQSLGL